MLVYWSNGNINAFSSSINVEEIVVSGSINNLYIVSLEKYKHFTWLLLLLSILLIGTSVLPGTKSHKLRAMDQLAQTLIVLPTS